jgi:hypothetical protein
MLRSEKGVAIIVAMMAILLLTTLGAALVLSTSTETMIAANFRQSIEARYAAGSVAELAVASLAELLDWNAALDGSMRSNFVDGHPGGIRRLADGTSVDLDAILNRARCGKVTSCTEAEMDARTLARPWGANNPRWQLYAHDYFDEIHDGGVRPTAFYVVALVGDDGLETDGDPLRDAADENSPGAGVTLVRAEAFGPRGTHAVAELTLIRSPRTGQVSILSWREIR